jgi:hypothetical protein
MDKQSTKHVIQWKLVLLTGVVGSLLVISRRFCRPESFGPFYRFHSR